MDERETLLTKARDSYERLLNSTGLSLSLKYDILDDLTKAGADFSVLDKTGKQSSEQMEAQFNARCREPMIRSAHYFYDDVKKRDSGNIESFQETISDALREADIASKLPYVHKKRDRQANENVDFSLLDKTGQKSSSEMKAEFDAEIRKAHIRVARKNMLHLDDSTDVIADLLNVQETYKQLRLANASLADLGPTPHGKTAAQDVQDYFSKQLKTHCETLGSKLVAEIQKGPNSGTNVPFLLSEFLYEEPAFSLTQLKPEDAEILGSAIARGKIKLDREYQKQRGRGNNRG